MAIVLLMNAIVPATTRMKALMMTGAFVMRPGAVSLLCDTYGCEENNADAFVCCDGDGDRYDDPINDDTLNLVMFH